MWQKRMQQRDFAKSEWTLVAAKGDLSEDIGSKCVVEAVRAGLLRNSAD